MGLGIEIGRWLNPVPEIEPAELKAKLDKNESFFLLDVRNPDEFELCRIPKGELIPLPQLAQRLGEIPKDKPVIVYCQKGGRSAKAAALLQEKGWKDVKNLVGGIDRWAEEIDPEMPRY